jgi:hypothetical protein
MNGAAAGLALLFFLPIGVIFGWIARDVGGRLDGRYPMSQPWVLELEELEPVRESRWEDSERYYPQRRYQELPQQPVINIHVTGMPSWQQPCVVDYIPATPVNREILP